MLGAGKIMVQRYGDILNGKRTWQKELSFSNVRPTLKDAVYTPITDAIISPLVHPLLSPRQCSPTIEVLRLSSIFILLL